MSPAISRRTAIMGATGALMTVAAGPAAATSGLVWRANASQAILWDMPSRIITRLPTVARYGQPIAVGTIIVQATCTADVVGKLRRANIDRVSGTGKCSLTATDPRGLTAQFLVDLTFPQTPMPETDVDFLITGTAAITSPLPLPLPRNKGPMRIAMDPRARADMIGWKPTGTNLLGFVTLTLKDGQDPTLTTIDIR
ncbi:hypothetical protein JOF56_005871 [Kibdelosporangium banguiense]|uniref:Tat pathway signal sequence domain protein n=1 Tax=Kibdelosporangium banguiense TaxID=1365924 RepID=A0ABS4TM48_9PSEU|nr:hypothetical protein [Kibdelosporangium banguiense]MBP2325486.1 hypothetical protein [Kibdelosporangium banguiense]